jgi:DNA-binding response OmpR family regulator
MNAEQSTLIVVADDDDDILDLVCLTLERDGHRILRASDGDEALELVRRHHPDACVLDVVMPERTGLEVIEELRRADETARIPILLLTATVQEKHLPSGLEKAGDAYLAKPFSPRELQRKVAVLLGRR